MYAHDLFRHERISTLNRWLVAIYAIGCLYWGYGLLFQNGDEAYDNPVFDGLFTIAHPVTWGFAWWTVGCMLMIAAISARAQMFLWALTALAGVLTGWVLGVLTHVIVSDAVLSSGAMALYMFSYTGLAGIALQPRPLDLDIEIYERNEEGVIVPLKRVERRSA